MVLDAGDLQDVTGLHVLDLLGESQVGVDVNTRLINDLDLLSGLLIIG